MPQINRKQIKPKKVKYKKENRSEEFYSKQAWRRLRDTYISLHPLCECCISHHVIRPASEVHHKVPFMRGETEEEQWRLFLDERNLMALCDTCHIALHNKDRDYNLSVLDELTEIEYRKANEVYNIR